MMMCVRLLTMMGVFAFNNAGLGTDRTALVIDVMLVELWGVSGRAESAHTLTGSECDGLGSRPRCSSALSRFDGGYIASTDGVRALLEPASCGGGPSDDAREGVERCKGGGPIVRSGDSKHRAYARRASTNFSSVVAR